MIEFNVYDYYNTQCNNDRWYEDFYSSNKNHHGDMYNVLDTNYRNILSFEKYFKLFEPYQDKPRNEWPKKTESHGQEIAKQYVVKLIDSYLYNSNRNDENELIYHITEKGKVFKKVIKSAFSDNEKRLLYFMLIFNGGFNRTPKYLINHTEYITNKMNEYKIDSETIKKNIVKVIREHINKRYVHELFLEDVIWLFNFFEDSHFINLFEPFVEFEDKKTLKNSTIGKYRSDDKKDVLAYKFKSTNKSKYTMLDNLLIYYLLSDLDMSNEPQFIRKKIISAYRNIYDINESQVTSFIEDNLDVFDVAIKSIYYEEEDYMQWYIPKKQTITLEESRLSEKVDTTSTKGIKRVEYASAALKKIAKESTGYRCSLEDMNSCRYFTSKEDGNNYLEIHHLIPREFSYLFDTSLEVINNYVPLCPHCHRALHMAVDRERKAMITFLYNKRKQKLLENNIDVDIKTLLELYKLDD